MKKFIPWIVLLIPMVCEAATPPTPAVILNGPESRLQYYPRLSSTTIGMLGQGILIYSNLSLLGGASYFNFAGAGCTPSVSGGTLTLTCNGSGGGGSGGGSLAFYTGSGFVTVSTQTFFPRVPSLSDGSGMTTYYIFSGTPAVDSAWTFKSSTTFVSTVTFQSVPVSAIFYGTAVFQLPAISSNGFQGGGSTFTSVGIMNVGTALKPSIALMTTANNGTGLYNGSGNNLDFTSNQTQVMSMSNTSLTMQTGMLILTPGGSISAPGIAYTSDQGAGIAFFGSAPTRAALTALGKDRLRWDSSGHITLHGLGQLSHSLLVSTGTTVNQPIFGVSSETMKFQVDGSSGWVNVILIISSQTNMSGLLNMMGLFSIANSTGLGIGNVQLTTYFSTATSDFDNLKSSVAAVRTSTSAIETTLAQKTLVGSDEGTPQASGATVTRLDFVGAGVAYTQSNGTGTVTVSGSGGGGSDGFGNPVSTRVISAQQGITASSGIIQSSMNVYDIVSSTTGALLKGATIQDGGLIINSGINNFLSVGTSIYATVTIATANPQGYVLVLTTGPQPVPLAAIGQSSTIINSSTFYANVIVAQSTGTSIINDGLIIQNLNTISTWTVSASSYAPTSGMPYPQVYISTNGQIVESTGAATIALTGCGTNPVVRGSRNAFTFTPGATAGGCTLTLTPPFNGVPTCLWSPQTQSLVNSVTFTETRNVLTFVETGMSGSWDVICIDH